MALGLGRRSARLVADVRPVRVHLQGGVVGTAGAGSRGRRGGLLRRS